MDSPKQYRMGKGFDKSDVVGLQSTGMRHLWYQKMSVWVDAVSSLGVSLHLVLVQALACFNVSVDFVSKWVGNSEGGRRGTKCSSVPRTRHPQECALSSWILCWDAEMRNGWYQSYIIMLSRCLVAYPFVSQEILALCMKVVVSSLKKWMLDMVVAEWRCCQHVSASPSLGANSCTCVSDLLRLHLLLGEGKG